MAKVKMQRRFKGKLFFWYNINSTKERANRVKKQLKAKGKRVRIVKHKHGFDVYSREGEAFYRRGSRYTRGKDF